MASSSSSSSSDHTKIHSYEEVSKRNQLKDCWLLISGKVYDVTQFMDDHPGGDQVLLSASGKDATGDFEEVGHSESAKELMEKYYIGEIDISTIPAKRTYVLPAQQTATSTHNPGTHNPDKSSDLGTKILQFLVPLMILGLAFAIRQFTKNKEY